MYRAVADNKSSIEPKRLAALNSERLLWFSIDEGSRAMLTSSWLKLGISGDAVAAAAAGTAVSKPDFIAGVSASPHDGLCSDELDNVQRYGRRARRLANGTLKTNGTSLHQDNKKEQT